MLSSIFYSASAQIKGGRSFPNIKGNVYFKETKNGVLLTAKIEGLPKSAPNCFGRFFGFHIHEGTSCSGDTEDEFANAKSHYNPNNCIHPYHAGDLPPLIETNGTAYISVLLNKFQIGARKNEGAGRLLRFVWIKAEQPGWSAPSWPALKWRKHHCPRCPAPRQLRSGLPGYRT